MGRWEETREPFSGGFRKWIFVYLMSSWSSNFALGIATTIVGPTQPFLAKKIGVSLDDINLAWTIQFIGFVIGSIMSGLLFKKYLKKPGVKLMYLGGLVCLAGFVTTSVPFLQNFPLMCTSRFIQMFGLGAFITSDASLVVYTMGPIKSRPFTNAIHAIAAIGCFCGTLIARPFLPSVSLDTAELCSNNASSPSGGDNEVWDAEYVLGVDKIAWPFIISGIVGVVGSTGYLLLALLPWTVPVFGSEKDSQHRSDEKPRVIRHWKTLLGFVFMFYLFACGIERIYQPMAFTFGICGPLSLTPAAAILIDTSYNGGFMLGRIVSVGIGGIVRPRTMLCVCLIFAFAASILLVIEGGTNVIALYVGTAVLGFFVSWQFGSCFSYIASKGDVTGNLSALFFIAGGVGSAIFPPLVGYIFTSESWGPMGILHVTCGLCFAQIFIFAVVWKLARDFLPREVETTTCEKSPSCSKS